MTHWVGNFHLKFDVYKILKYKKKIFDLVIPLVCFEKNTQIYELFSNKQKKKKETKSATLHNPSTHHKKYKSPS